MKVDYLFFAIEGIERAGIVNPPEMRVIVRDHLRRNWSDFNIPLDAYNNIVRGRDEANMHGNEVVQNILAAAQWLIPPGKYQIIVDNALVHLQQQTALGWVGAVAPTGVVESDGVNYRLNNTAGAPANAIYRRVDYFGKGEWWLDRPFWIQRQQAMTVRVINRMTTATIFNLVFSGYLEHSGKPYQLVETIGRPSVFAAGASQTISGRGFQSQADEPFIITSMSYAEIDGSAGFDPMFIDLQIEPSQGNAWSEVPIPLGVHANLRGDQAAAFHKPQREVILEATEWLGFDFSNYSVAARNVHVAVVGHVYSDAEEKQDKKIVEEFLKS